MACVNVSPASRAWTCFALFAVVLDDVPTGCHLRAERLQRDRSLVLLRLVLFADLAKKLRFRVHGDGAARRANEPRELVDFPCRFPGVLHVINVCDVGDSALPLPTSADPQTPVSRTPGLKCMPERTGQTEGAARRAAPSVRAVSYAAFTSRRWLRRAPSSAPGTPLQPARTSCRPKCRPRCRSSCSRPTSDRRPTASR